MWSKVLLFSGIYLIRDHVACHCIDIHSQIVSQGLHYVPGPNTCTLCICDKGSPKWCKSVLCSPPQNCKSFQVGNSCCEFKCLDDILTANDGYKDTYDLALRLIASAVTAILSLSLLFFLIHRLRKRKVRVRQSRQLNEDQRSLNSIGYIAGSLGYLTGNIGYLGSGNNDLEFHYEESNAHFSLWKPPGNYFPRGEAPPPYEEAVRTAQVEINNQIRINEGISVTNMSNIYMPQREVPCTQPCNAPIQTRRDNLEYANIAVQNATVHHPDESMKTDYRPEIKTANDKLQVKNSDRTEKSKSYENITVHRATTSSHNTKKSNDKNYKYENIAVKDASQVSKEIGRKLEKAKAIDDYYAEIDNEPCYENMRHRTVPNLSELKDAMRLKKECILNENASRKAFYKSQTDERSDGNLKSLLREQKHLPLHRTLPKNLRELTIPVTSISDYNPNETLRSETEQLLHRSLPKHINTHEVPLTVNLIRTHLPEFTVQNKLEVESKVDERVKNDHSFISYRCLSSSQDEDDYRSECENCKASGFTNIENEEGDVVETMTLQRRPLETTEEVSYYRTSLTLPTQTKKPRSVTSNPGRESWFMAMHETSSSEESD